MSATMTTVTILVLARIACGTFLASSLGEYAEQEKC